MSISTAVESFCSFTFLLPIVALRIFPVDGPFGLTADWKRRGRTGKKNPSSGRTSTRAQTRNIGYARAAKRTRARKAQRRQATGGVADGRGTRRRRGGGWWPAGARGYYIMTAAAAVVTRDFFLLLSSFPHNPRVCHAVRALTCWLRNAVVDDDDKDVSERPAGGPRGAVFPAVKAEFSENTCALPPPVKVS